MTKNPQELKPIIRRKPIPVNAVAKLRGKVQDSKSKLVTAHVQLHQDFLLNMFNPNSEEMDRFERTYFNKDGSVERQVIVVKDFLKEHPENTRGRLPNISEFKMFLWMLKQAQINKTQTLDFDSRSQCLEHLGYSLCPENFELLLKTINMFFCMGMVFHKEFTAIKKTKSGKKTTRTVKIDGYFKILNGRYQELNSKTKEVLNISIRFEHEFLQACNGHYGFVKYLDLNKVNQFDSPLALKIYLYLVKWSNARGEFQRNYASSLDDFLSVLGFETKELSSAQIHKLKFRIKAALEQVAVVDPKLSFTLDDLVFNNKTNRQVKFRQTLVSEDI